MTAPRYLSGVRLIGLLSVGAVALLIHGMSAADPPPAASESAHDFRTTVAPLLETHCAGCHGGKKPKGDLDLTKFTSPESLAADFPVWEAVVEQIRSGEMPPKTAKTRPTADERKAVAAWAEAFRKREAERTAGDPGVVLARRLSNAEYDNTVRDLTGVDIRPAKDFPVDPANTAGFDNSGESLRMSPALVTKYMAAARHVADHLLLMPDGFTFAPYPVITETDRDKFCVRRIVDFYLAQPTDLTDYFLAAWKHQHRATLGKPNATHADAAAEAKVSAKYLAVVWPLLTEPAGETGPVAALQSMWNALPKDAKPGDVRRECKRMAEFVGKLRGQVAVKVDNLHIPGMGDGSQTLVLWKDREMAANRRKYAGNGLQVKGGDLGFGPAVAKALTAPTEDADKKRYEQEFERFCGVFPDAFFVKERSRIFLDPKEDRGNTGRLLSAGFHNQMGYFRDDGPLYDLVLDAAGRKHLDRLWAEFDFASDVPARMHSGFIWFERAESGYIRDPMFDFIRAEDKDATSPEKFAKFAEVYMKRTKKATNKEVQLKAVADHFKISEANIRRVEKARVDSEPTHKKAVQELAARAYRRPLTDKERDNLTAFYTELRNDGATHEEAIRDCVVRVLMSPHFCFRLDRPMPGGNGTPGKAEPLSDYALASRLSYFLWASMPDRELMACAENGTLHQPAVLLAQARRMIRDDRSRGLAEQFGGNWLGFARFDEHNAVDRERYPQFDTDLRRAMYEEPVRFLYDLFRNDRPVHELLDGKHTFVNAPLAKHYGIPAPAKSDGWVRVDDADKYGRGGLLPMAAFLTKNSPGLRTSPVKRGYWVVTRLLGERIPAPPPNVPELPADEKKLTLSLRDTLAKHRENASCAACHARFDSFGLAFEGFGPVGEKRTKDLAGNPVDTHVSFPGDTDGDGVTGLRDFLMNKRADAFRDTLCRKLLAFALGRTLILSDEATVAVMRARLTKDDDHPAGLIEVIVTSPQFLNRRADAPTREGSR